MAEIVARLAATRLTLNVLNVTRDPAELARTLANGLDGPDALERLKGPAAAILEQRSALPGGRFTSLDEVAAVAGLGPDGFRDVTRAFARLPKQEKALLYVNTEPDAEVFAELVSRASDAVDAVEGFASLRHAAALVFATRSELPDTRFATLAEITQHASEISTETIDTLARVFGEPETDAGPSTRAVLRTELAQSLWPLLSRERRPVPLRGTDTLGDTISALAGADDDYEAWVRARLILARTVGAAGLDERVADVASFPQVANVRVERPARGLDPAALPELSSGHRWLKSRGSVFLAPDGPATLELLTDQGWQEAGPLRTAVWVDPAPNGVIVRGALAEGLRARGVAGTTIGPALAVRIRSRDGIAGRTTGIPVPLGGVVGDLTAFPEFWGRPGRELWVNPLPGLPPLATDQPTGGKPRVVTVGRDDDQSDEEAGGGGVVIGWGDVGAGAGGGGGGGGAGGAGGAGGGGGFGIVIVRDPCSVTIAGCACLRRSAINQYTAQGLPDGGSYVWSVDDDDIAEIVGPNDQRQVKVRGKAIGKVTLTVDYTKNGCATKASLGVAMVYQRFTLRDRPRAEIVALSLFQPAPSVRVAPDSVSHELIEIQPERRRAKFHLSLTGQLKDPLIDITGVDIIAGREFRRSLSRTENEFGVFSDEGFRARKVEVYGPGRSYVRVKARNSIGFHATDTVDLTIRIAPHWEENLASLADTLAFDRERGADASVIADSEARLRRAWELALATVEVDIGTLVHPDNTVERVPGNRKWSIAVEDDASMGVADVASSKDRHSITIEEKSRKLLTPRAEPKNYFLLHDAYEKDRLTWEDDGLVLAAASDPIALTYFDPCCGHTAPAVAVTVDPLPGVQWIERQESITLSAAGQPESLFGVPGIYHWKVDAHPAGAVFRFEPDGPTMAKTVKFFTDTPGIYGFRVDYQLAGASSPWTYALADAQILFEIDSVAELHRLGDYDGELAPHRTRPLYMVRPFNPAESVAGAEVQVRSRAGGPLGQDLDVTVLCPTLLKLKASLRAYFADGTDRDFALPTDAGFPFRAHTTIRSARVIQRLLIRPRYENVTRMEGDAVWIDVRVRPLEPVVADLETAPTPPAVASGMVAIDIPSEEIGVSAPQDDDAAPLVNLILRTRDLGWSVATNAMVGTAFRNGGVNLVNGNHHQSIALFDVIGGGYDLELHLNYDSRAATRAYAVRQYGRLNGKRRDDLQHEFGHDVLGDGWSLSVDPGLFEFVVPEGNADRPFLRRCVEVRDLDGNRIVFGATGPRVYQVLSDAETRGRDPDAALSSELLRESGGWRLRLGQDLQYEFDEEGRLKGWRDRRSTAPGRSLPPVMVARDLNEIRLRDSTQREVILHLVAGRIARIETPEQKEWLIVHDRDELRSVSNPLGAAWQFQYIEHGLMREAQPPEGHPLVLGHYLGTEIEGVPKSIAEHFWGAVASVDFGTRHLSVRYEARTASQPVIVVDPGGHRRRYRFDSTRQAADRVEYAHRDTPNDWQHFATFEYRGDSKAVLERADHTHASWGFGYEQSGARGYVTNRESYPDGHSTVYRYVNGERRSIEDPFRSATAQIYDVDGQVKEVTYPTVTAIGFDLAMVSLQPKETRAYDSWGRLMDVVTYNQVAIHYGYDDPAGDPSHTGLPTSMTITVTHLPADGGAPQKAQVTWKYGWDVMGRRLWIENPRGHRQDWKYDDAGRIHQMIDGGNQHTYEYDGLDRVRSVTDALGRVARLELDVYGEMKSRTDATGHTIAVNDRDENGNIAVITLEDGAEYRYEEYDALGRYRRMQFPEVERRQRRGLESVPVPDLVADYIDQPSSFAFAGGVQTTRISYTAGDRKRIRHLDGRGHEVGDEIHEDGRITTVARRFDAAGNLEKVELFEGRTQIATLLHQRRDALGRITERTESGVTIRLGDGWDEKGAFHVEVYPAQERQSGTPWFGTRFDALGRPTEVVDGTARALVRQTYDDADGTTRIYSRDASLDDINAPLAHISTIRTTPQGLTREVVNELASHSTSYTFDRIGRVNDVTTLRGMASQQYDELDRLTQTAFGVSEATADPDISGLNPPDPTVTSATVRVDFRFDPAGRSEFSGSSTIGELILYDALGRPAAIERTGLGGSAGLREELFYDRGGALRGRWFGAAFGRGNVGRGGLPGTPSADPGHGFWVLRKDPPRRRVEEVRSLPGFETTNVMTFDPAGRLREVSSSAHHLTFGIEYDSRGRPTGEVTRKAGREIGRIVRHYDGGGVFPDAITISAGGSSRDVRYAYDANLRITRVEADEFGGAYELANNPAGLLRELRRPIAGAVTTFAFTPDGAVREVSHAHGEAWADTWTSRVSPDGRDAFGNPQQIDEELIVEGERLIAIDTRYQFDAANRRVRTTIESQTRLLQSKLTHQGKPHGNQ